MPRLRIGTRGSDLALWQARHVAERLGGETELIEIRTGGDLLTDVPLSRLSDKAFFTKEIEEALLAGAIDLAVHSLKDLATTLPAGLVIGAVLARDDPRDALLAGGSIRSLADLPRGARVGTSSLRRRAFLARSRPDLQGIDLRGNVPTRIHRLDEGKFDALILAAAGVERLGLEARISCHLPARVMPPAPGQGTIAIQIRADDATTARHVSALDDQPTRLRIGAERAFLRRLEGGCQVPVGAHAFADPAAFHLFGAICSLDGKTAVDGQLDREWRELADVQAFGTELAERLLHKGGAEILAAIRRPADGKPDS